MIPLYRELVTYGGHYNGGYNFICIFNRSVRLYADRRSTGTQGLSNHRPILVVRFGSYWVCCVNDNYDFDLKPCFFSIVS
jgi:hypothetical protein